MFFIEITLLLSKLPHFKEEDKVLNNDDAHNDRKNAKFAEGNR